MQRIFAIAHNTFREAVRDRILLAAAVFAVGIIVFAVFLGSVSLEQDKKIIEDAGLASIFLLQMFVTVFVGASLLHKEVDRKTLYLILPKPVRRGEILLGKFAGMCLVNAAMTALTTAVLLAVLLLSFRTTGALPGILLAVGFGYVEVAVLSLVSIFFASFSSPILSAVYTVCVFIIGHSTDLVQAVIRKQNVAAVKYALTALAYIFPNLEKFNIRNDVVYGALPSIGSAGLMLLYAAAYSAMLAIVSILIFSKREF